MAISSGIWTVIPLARSKNLAKPKCSYCKNKIKNLDIINSGYYNSGVIVTIRDNQLHTNAWFDSFYGIDVKDVKINYCPMCGRKLE
jgi:hypothetical protein